MKMTQVRYGLLVAVLGLLLAPGVVAQPYSGFYNFGESLSDTGNFTALFAQYGIVFPPSPPYAPGHFSNGQMYVEVVAENFDLGEVIASLDGGNNYAYGGARSLEPNYFAGIGIPSVREQIETFLADVDGNVDPDALYVIQIGGNDAMAAYGALVQNGWDAGAQVMEDAAAGVLGSVELLAQYGAVHFVVPGAHLNSVTPGYCGISEIDALGDLYNTRLEEGLADIEGGLDIVFFDTKAFEEAMSDQFIPCTPCVNHMDPSSVCEDPDEHRNWDDMGHISAAANQLIGDAISVAMLEHRVVALTAGGSLNPGQANALLSKLRGAFSKLGDRSVGPATNKLHALENQVEAFVRVGILSPDDAELLLVGAAGIIEQP